MTKRQTHIELPDYHADSSNAVLLILKRKLYVLGPSTYLWLLRLVLWVQT